MSFSFATLLLQALAEAKAAAQAAKNEPNGLPDKDKPVAKINLKQMQDVRSSQASAVIQLFLRQIQGNLVEMTS